MPIINPQEALKHPESLSPQIKNLLATIVRNDSHLIESRKIDYSDEQPKRPAVHISREDLDAAVKSHRGDPFRTHRLFNRAIANIREQPRIPREQSRVLRYISASCDLEILLDRLAFPETDVNVGIPRYLMDGYTPLEQEPNSTEKRKEFRIEKDRLREHLVLAREHLVSERKSLVLAVEKTAEYFLEEEGLLDWIARYAASNTEYNLTGAEKITSEYRDRRVTMGIMQRSRYATCRHHAILGQVLLQVAGKKARIENGSRGIIRHAWIVLEESPERMLDITRKLIDKEVSAVVMEKKLDDGKILTVASGRPVYYQKAPDDTNHYRIVHS